MKWGIYLLRGGFVMMSEKHNLNKKGR